MDEFNIKAKLKHGETYDYSKVEYKNSVTKVIIICKVHDEFLQTPNGHLSGRGCDRCGGTKDLDTNTFKILAKRKHGETYEYSNSEYKSSRKKVLIICKVHGEFLQLPSNHLFGAGCRKCADIVNAQQQSSNTQDFIDKVNVIHNHLYNYSKVIYKNRNTDVIIICSIHGEFLQTPRNHLIGCGCQCCKNKTEGKLKIILQPYYMSLLYQFSCVWCKKQNPLRFDFCIPELNIIIELDGKQHFQQVLSWSSPEEQFENDKYKETCANKNGYSVIRLLQTDVWNDTYDWCFVLRDAIEKIKIDGIVTNVYLCKNGEYDKYI